MDNEKNYSRVNKYDKRRKTTKSITVLMIIAVVLVILLIAVLVFGRSDKKDTNDESPNGQDSSEEVTDGDLNKDDTTEGTNEDTEENEEESDDEDQLVEIEDIPEEEIDDPNVIEAYTANWKPVGTNQEEPHTTVFDKESDDWTEMMQAIAYALKIEEDEFENYWIGNGGEQRVNGHVQSLITDEHYTVYLEWQENEGWKPIKVERVEKFIHPNQAD